MKKPEVSQQLFTCDETSGSFAAWDSLSSIETARERRVSVETKKRVKEQYIFALQQVPPVCSERILPELRCFARGFTALEIAPHITPPGKQGKG